MQIRLSSQGFILVLVPLLVQVIFMIAFFVILQQAEGEIAREQRSREIVSSLNHIARMMLASSAGLTIRSQSGDTSSTSVLVPQEFARLKVLVQEHPEQVAAIENLELRWQASFEAMRDIKEYAKSGDNFAVLAKVAKVQGKLQSVYKVINDTATYFESLQNQSPALQRENRRKQKLALLAFLIVDVVMALALCLYFSRKTGSRLNTLMQDARSLVVGKPIFTRLSGSDELAELQKTLITMADLLAQARQKERAILDNAEDIICSLDASGSILTVSKAAQKLWGYAQDDLLGMRLAELIEPTDWNATRQMLSEIREHAHSGDIENHVVTASGTTIAMLWRVNWSTAEKNFFCVAHDITARRELERLKLEFMSMITHDIRSPINSVQAFLSMMNERVYGDLNEKGWQRLHAVEQSVDLVSKLISDLLDLEKAESGMLVLERDDTLSQRIIANSINVVRNLAERKNISVVQEGSSFDLDVDENRMIQVFVNLISNAIKFSPAGSSITVSGSQIGSRAIFRVQDEGPGIKPEFQSRIFDRFEQLLDRTSTTESESEATERVRRVKGSAGSGLGLAIAKAIVEAHGGRISVESDGVHGTAFVVEIGVK